MHISQSHGSFLWNIPAQMSWMRLASGFASCVFSSWCCNDAEFTKVMQQNDQLHRVAAELRQKLEVLQITVGNTIGECYGADQACVIEVTDEWVGYLHVHQFATEANFDFLHVNDVAYSRIMSTPPFNGVVPNGTIFWSADCTFNEAGFKIYRTT